MAKEQSVAPTATLVHVRGASQDTAESKCIACEMRERRRKLASVAREDTRKKQMPSAAATGRI